MLEDIINEKELFDFGRAFSRFDKKAMLFLYGDFDTDKFLKQCTFNTTGYYEDSEYDKCLNFTWKINNNPKTTYEIQIDKNNK